jgi:hypothetical protein
VAYSFQPKPVLDRRHHDFANRTKHQLGIAHILEHEPYNM